MSRFIFININGTLLQPGARRTEFSAAWLARFRTAVAQMQQLGFEIGLSSDTPLVQIEKFGEQIGLRANKPFPVLAENGDVLALNGEVTVVRPSYHLSLVRPQVEWVAREMGLEQQADVVTPEFTGSILRIRVNKWGFGANRLASVSVFGPAAFITEAEQHLVAWSQQHGHEIGVHCRPENNFLVVHAYKAVNSGKGAALASLAKDAERVIMIGNSESEWVAPQSRVMCAFVANATIPNAMRSQAWYMAAHPSHDGVIDVLHYVQQTHHNWLAHPAAT